MLDDFSYISDMYLYLIKQCLVEAVIVAKKCVA